MSNMELDAAQARLLIAEGLLSVDAAVAELTARYSGITELGARVLLDPEPPRCEMRTETPR